MSLFWSSCFWGIQWYCICILLLEHPLFGLHWPSCWNIQWWRVWVAVVLRSSLKRIWVGLGHLLFIIFIFVFSFNLMFFLIITPIWWHREFLQACFSKCTTFGIFCKFYRIFRWSGRQHGWCVYFLAYLYGSQVGCCAWLIPGLSKSGCLILLSGLRIWSYIYFSGLGKFCTDQSGKWYQVSFFLLLPWVLVRRIFWQRGWQWFAYTSWICPSSSLVMGRARPQFIKGYI